MELGMTQIPLFSLWALKVELVANKDDISDVAEPGTPWRFDRPSFLSFNSLLFLRFLGSRSQRYDTHQRYDFYF
jgi:hypothetical protein